MSQETNLKAVALFDEIVKAREFHRIPEVFAEDVIDHDAADGQGPGVSGVIAFWKGFASSFPDLRVDADLLLADDEYVTLAYRFSGTDTGGFMGYPPTGRHFSVRALEIAKFADGLEVERWGATDTLGILNQLGLVP